MREEIREHNGENFHLRYYCDWLDFVSYAEQVERGQNGGEYGGMRCRSVEQGELEWFGTNTLAEAISFARKGWFNGRQKVRDMRRLLNIKNLLPYSQRIHATRDVAGDEPDIDLFLQGEPENMITPWESQTAQRGKVVRFIINRTVSANVDGDEIVRRGIALIIAFETLIQLGYSVNVTICFSVHGEGETRMEWYIPVLHAGDPINMDTLAFMFIQPAVCRRLQFAVSECEPRKIREQFNFYTGGGYGHPPFDPFFLPEHDLFIEYNEGLFYKNEQVVPFVFDILHRVGMFSNQ